jgi:hypothetical protein
MRCAEHLMVAGRLPERPADGITLHFMLCGDAQIVRAVLSILRAHRSLSVECSAMVTLRIRAGG